MKTHITVGTRSTNENLNTLSETIFPKDANSEFITYEQRNRIVSILNNRPRKRFGFKTPNKVLDKKLNENISAVFMP